MKTRVASEFLGTMFLLMVVVGSGIMGERLAGGNTAIALLANSLATGAGLFVLIQCLGPLSGAHLNPVVSGIEWMRGVLNLPRLAAYWLSQFSGAIVGVGLTHLMFGRSFLEISTHDRASSGLLLSEMVASFGLIATITLAGRRNPEGLPLVVAAYITSAYWFTSSTSFANPAVTLARMLTDTFCGIAPDGVPGFMAAQVVGAGLAYGLLRKLKV